MITAGKVSVNGQVVTDLGHRVDPERDQVAVEGRNIARDVERLYVALYKPKGYVTTRHDPHAAHTVMDLIRPPLEAKLGRGHPAVEGLHPVGRLDTQTEGLLILTNDGSFTNAITHPRHRVPKIYRAEVRGVPGPEALERLRKGVPLFGQRTLPARVSVTRVDRSREISYLEIELREGRNQQIRRMLQAVGFPVNWLQRVSVGPMTLGRMKPGQWRFLTEMEVEMLLKMATEPEDEASAPPPHKHALTLPRDGSRKYGNSQSSHGSSRGSRPPKPTGTPPRGRTVDASKPSGRQDFPPRPGGTGTRKGSRATGNARGPRANGNPRGPRAPKRP